MWDWYLDTLCIYWPDTWTDCVCGTGNVDTLCVCVGGGLILRQVVYVGLVLWTLCVCVGGLMLRQVVYVGLVLGHFVCILA